MRSVGRRERRVAAPGVHYLVHLTPAPTTATRLAIVPADTTTCATTLLDVHFVM